MICLTHLDATSTYVAERPAAAHAHRLRDGHDHARIDADRDARRRPRVRRCRRRRRSTRASRSAARSARPCSTRWRPPPRPTTSPPTLPVTAGGRRTEAALAGYSTAYWWGAAFFAAGAVMSALLFRRRGHGLSLAHTPAAAVRARTGDRALSEWRPPRATARARPPRAGRARSIVSIVAVSEMRKCSGRSKIVPGMRWMLRSASASQ